MWMPAVGRPAPGLKTTFTIYNEYAILWIYSHTYDVTVYLPLNRNIKLHHMTVVFIKEQTNLNKLIT